MMVKEKEKTSIRTFVRCQLRDEPDLSTLTLRILKKRYLAHMRCESLTSEAKYFMKQVVGEELMKMQDDDDHGNGKELETKQPQNKRKREKENDDEIRGIEDEDESRAKKSRYRSSSSSESEDKKDCKTGSEENEEEKHIKSGSEDEEQDLKKSQIKTNGMSKRKINSDESADEEIKESGKNGNESKDADSPKEIKKKKNSTKNSESKSSSISQGQKTQSDEEDETHTDSKTENRDKINESDSSDNSEKEEEASMEKKNDPDSDSSSLPSLEDEKDGRRENKTENKKEKNEKKEESTRSQKDNNRAVVRLKRYIALCGVRQNYKKLLGGCHSVRSQVAVLKKELEVLGVQGQPSIKKCKNVRMKREQAQELAELDTSNIIATKGRPKRRGAAVWQEQHSHPSSTHRGTLNSSSDSDQENNEHRGRRRATDWANLKGIISDDADSN